MKKKLTSIMLIFVLSLNMFSLSIIAADKEELYAGNQLRILGLLKGYEDGSLKLDNNIVRGEVAALAVRMLGYEDQNVDGEDKQFSDITKKYWGYNVVQKAYKLKIINGYPDSTFKPTNNISYAEVVAIMVNILGQNKDLEGTWPNNYLNRGKSLGIIPKDSTVPGDKIVTRGEMAVIIWDTLLVKQK